MGQYRFCITYGLTVFGLGFEYQHRFSFALYLPFITLNMGLLPHANGFGLTHAV